MASANTGALITGGLQVGGQLLSEALFGGAERKARKKALKAQESLLTAQADYQRLQNQALSMSLAESHALLPLSSSLVGPSPSAAGKGALPEGLAPVPAASVQAAGFSGLQLFLVLGVVAAVVYAGGKAWAS